MVDEWVVVEIESEEDTLRKCWESLPFAVSFEDFKAQMVAMKSKPNVLINCIHKLYFVWSAAGYLVMFTDVRYKMVVIELMKWFLKA